MGSGNAEVGIKREVGIGMRPSTSSGESKWEKKEGGKVGRWEGGNDLKWEVGMRKLE